MNKESLVIGVDFDGTVVSFAYPLIGKDIGAVPVLKKIVAAKHRLMLWTMRCNKPGNYTLQDAVNWFKENGIELWGINENPEQQASGWSTSHKQHADYFIDDAAIGAPLILDKKISPRPFINWEKIDKKLKEMGLY